MKSKIKAWDIKLRDWQIESTDKFLRKYFSGYDNFLCVATPGAGKTIAALRKAHYLINKNEIDLIIVVVPKENLKIQFAQDAYKKNGQLIGLHFDPNYKPGTFRVNDYHGFCVTYSQVANISEILNVICGKYRVMMIADEIHHAGDLMTWGDALEKAFINAKVKLCLSGTPFRSDDCKIPFVNYNEGVCISDFEYTYERAVKEGVCREVNFYSYDGSFHWSTKTVSKEKEIAKNISECETEILASECLQVAINPKADYFKQMLIDAHNKLIELRNTINPIAGGIVIARDQMHARQIAKIIEQTTGEIAPIIISDDAKSKDNITKFANSSGKWIISVQMISEGTDIPRLMVELYVTNIRTELFFRQAIGRIVRMLKDLPTNQKGYVFFPKLPKLYRMAKNIQNSITHNLNKIEKKYEPIILNPSGEERTVKELFLYDSQVINIDLFGQAIAENRNTIISKFKKIESEKENEPSEPNYITRQQLINEINNRVSIAASKLGKTRQEIHSAWIAAGGIKGHHNMNQEQLKKKSEWIYINYIRKIAK